LLQLKDPKDVVEGILMTSKGPMLISSRPVLNNNREGPVRGAVIIGKLLNSDLVAKLREQTQIQFEVLPPPPRQGSLTARREDPVDARTLPIRIDDSRPGMLHVSATLGDITGVPILPIEAAIPREITAKGQHAMRFASYSLAAVGFVVLVALLVFLQWMVLGPVSRLTEHAVRVGQADDLTARLSMKSGDEIGTLAKEFDHMVERLADARKELIDQSYESGIAEMASGALHNVRNALTPVLVELDMLRQELAKVPVDQIDLAKQQLGDDTVPESRRQDLEKFLDLASGRLVSMTRATTAKLGDVSGRARQIEQFLADQAHAGRADRPVEWVGIAELIRDAVMLLPGDLRERLSVETGPGVAKLQSVKTHRTCLLQVVGNLLTNAAEAIGEAGKGRGTVTVDAEVEEADGSCMVHLRVRDDGVGIAPENLGRIFERGFTTKGKAARGTGLHWCANSVAAMGGRMYSESDGIGHGACIHVVLPKVL
jgi:signal transduction histidine kinase